MSPFNAAALAMLIAGAADHWRDTANTVVSCPDDRLLMTSRWRRRLIFVASIAYWWCVVWPRERRSYLVVNVIVYGGE